MTKPPDHKDSVREEFTKQADAYAKSSLITDSEKIERLVRATDISPEARVLEIATGPGHVGFGFAEECEEVVGIDITTAPLEIARETKRERGFDNVSFIKGDAENLPFDDDSFDIVVCRLAFHHFERPSSILREMSRVCRIGGTIAVDDLTVSEFPDRASYQNRFERLRDPSHFQALPLSELLALFAENGIEITSVRSGTIVQEVEQWLSLSQTPDDRAQTVRDLLKADADADLSGTRPFWQDGKLYFTQRTMLVVGRQLHDTKFRSEPGETTPK